MYLGIVIYLFLFSASSVFISNHSNILNVYSFVSIAPKLLMLFSVHVSNFANFSCYRNHPVSYSFSHLALCFKSLHCLCLQLACCFFWLPYTPWCVFTMFYSSSPLSWGPRLLLITNFNKQCLQECLCTCHLVDMGGNFFGINNSDVEGTIEYAVLI